MLSDSDITLYEQLTEVSLKLENAVKTDDFSRISELATVHNTVMGKIKSIGQIEDVEMIVIIKKAEESVKNTMAVIQQKQLEIAQQLNSEKNKKLLSNSYKM